jgi:diguanylate cyclase (GGDEF)-like protein
MFTDFALRRAAQAIRQNLPLDAVVGHESPGHFGILLPGVDVGGALGVGRRLCAELAAQPFSSMGETVSLTVSVGVATLYRTTGGEELVEDSRAALTRAKTAGGNSVRGPQEVAA